MILIKFAAFAAVLPASFCDAIHLVKRAGRPAVVKVPIEKNHFWSNSLQRRVASKTLCQTLDNNVRHTDALSLKQKTYRDRETSIMPMSH